MSAPSNAMTPEASRTRTLVILYPGCIAFEVLLAADVLQGCTFATTDDRPHGDGSGLRISPTCTFAAAISRDHDVILIPGGNPDAVIENQKLRTFLRRCIEDGTIVGGICAGVLVLAASGALRGKRITHNYREPYCPPDLAEKTSSFWEGSVYVDEPCVEDDNVVTAKPFAYVDFATTVARKVGVYDATEEARLNRYFKGEYIGRRTR